MKRTKKIFVVTSLISTMMFQVTTYALTSKSPAASDTLYKNTFIMDDPTFNIDGQLDIKKLLEKDVSIKATTKEPKILIIHSHPQEEYFNDKNNNKKESVLDVGDELERVLEENYKVSVFHYTDKKNTQTSVVGAYERIERAVEDILKKNPSIEVIIDVHRGGGTEPTAALMDGKSTAEINIVNGLSLDESIGKIGSLKTHPNPYVEENLSLSAQMKYKSDKLTPNLISHVRLQQYRYSLHMMPKSLMIDIGNNMDTLDSAKNAIQPFTEVLADVLNLEKIDK